MAFNVAFLLSLKEFLSPPKATVHTHYQVPSESSGPMSTIPTEILQRIFVSCIGDENIPFYLHKLSLACRHWRDSVLGCPDLWCYIHSRMNRAFILQSLRHSQSLCLHVTVDGAFWSDVLIDLLKTDMHRVQTLWLIGANFKYTPIMEFLSIPSPSLQSLTIRGQYLGSSVFVPKHYLMRSPLLFATSRLTEQAFIAFPSPSFLPGLRISNISILIPRGPSFSVSGPSWITHGACQSSRCSR
ncbi:hypothetical protein BV25DRAFT_170464 [Artomyces pyxidatus]|uniref:Uncharacterized protein n=1 Tax=Artomyces pyxidatus TaxID=48021 RepID=A0ACB8SG78_9AGAM|nr:hypothetical protein BV25DRAFT_170464 [Artomyces pyxidatus]